MSDDPNVLALVLCESGVQWEACLPVSLPPANSQLTDMGTEQFCHLNMELDVCCCGSYAALPDPLMSRYYGPVKTPPESLTNEEYGSVRS